MPGSGRAGARTLPTTLPGLSLVGLSFSSASCAWQPDEAELKLNPTDYRLGPTGGDPASLFSFLQFPGDVDNQDPV